MIEEISSTSENSVTSESRPRSSERFYTPNSSTCSRSYLGETSISQSKRKFSKPQSQPTRRFRGFLISIQGEQARVAFIVEGSSPVEYFLPAKMLRKAKITQRLQPFEMDELEEQSHTEATFGYSLRPMAEAGKTFEEILTIDDELTDLRDAALSYFGEKSSD